MAFCLGKRHREQYAEIIHSHGTDDSSEDSENEDEDEPKEQIEERVNYGDSVPL